MPTIHSLFSDDEDDDEETNPDPGKANYPDSRIGEGSGEEVEGIVV